MRNLFKILISISLSLILFISNIFASNIVIATTPGGDTGSSSGTVSQRIYGKEITQNNNLGPGAAIGSTGTSISTGPNEVSITNNNTTTQNATTTTTNNQTTTNTELIQLTNANVQLDGKPSITSESAIVVNLSTNQYYVSKDENTQLAPASLTNLVTSYLLLKNAKLSDIVSVSKSAISNLESGANNILLQEGDTISVENLLHAMLLKSACDCANIAAEKVSGSINNFVTLMNETVKSWGCNNTNFTNPSGLNDDKQYTSAYDMAIILSKISKDENIVNILRKTSYTLPKTAHRNSLFIESNMKISNNTSSFYDQRCSFGKQGYTTKAKYTLAVMYKYKDQDIATVVLKSNGDHYNLSKALLNYAIKVIDSGNTTLASSGIWSKDNTGWYYIKNDGTKAVNEWIDYKGNKFCVDASGYMITGWREFTNGSTYYFDLSTGELKYNTWINTSTGAYFLQADGSLAKADAGKTKEITTAVGKYKIDDTGKALSKVE
ncbi:MAG: serine hydrolase [Eubacteriales bacterium]|nr:serine hydrolase [Eubacteriales bacterium]